MALVEVIAAGDSINRAPPRGTPATPLSAAAQGHLFDLTGYGGRLRVVELISGSMPQEVDVDAGVRSGLEEGLRGIEATGNVPPCRLDSFRTRYEPGGMYAALLIERDSGWQTQIAYRVSGEDALVTNDYSPGAVSPPLTLGDELHETFLKGVDAKAEYPEGVETGPLGQVWMVTADRVPLSSLLDAMRAAHKASIQPPATGSAGLAH